MANPWVWEAGDAPGSGSRTCLTVSHTHTPATPPAPVLSRMAPVRAGVRAAGGMLPQSPGTPGGRKSGDGETCCFRARSIARPNGSGREGCGSGGCEGESRPSPGGGGGRRGPAAPPCQRGFAGGRCGAAAGCRQAGCPYPESGGLPGGFPVTIRLKLRWCKSLHWRRATAEQNSLGSEGLARFTWRVWGFLTLLLSFVL